MNRLNQFIPPLYTFSCCHQIIECTSKRLNLRDGELCGMNCPKCGADFEDSFKFCPNCAEPNPIAASPQQPPPQRPPPPVSLPPQQGTQPSAQSVSPEGPHQQVATPSSEIQVGGKCIAISNIVIDGRTAFCKGDYINVESINPNPAKAGYKYEAYSKLLGKHVELSDQELSADKKRLKSKRYYDRAIKAGANSRYKRSLALFEKAARLNPEDTGIYLMRSILLRRLGRTAEAIEDVSRLYALDPTQNTLAMRSEYLAESGRYQEAIEDSNRAIELEPFDGDSYFTRATCHQHLGDIESAIKDYTMALTYLVSNKEEDVLFLRALCYREMKEYDLALSDFGRVIELDNSDVDAYLWRSEVHLGMERADLAVLDCEKAVSLQPQQFDVHDFYARALFFSDRYEESFEQVNIAISINPENTKGYFTRAVFFEELGQFEMARKDYSYILLIDPGNEAALKNLKLDHLQ